MEAGAFAEINKRRTKFNNKSPNCVNGFAEMLIQGALQAPGF